jgi:hypothetical protein
MARPDAELTAGRLRCDGQKILRSTLGFGVEALIGGSPGSAKVVGGLRLLYAIWAARYLSGDGDNLTAYAYFLTQPVAVHLLGDGIKQIAHALGAGCAPRA